MSRQLQALAPSGAELADELRRRVRWLNISTSVVGALLTFAFIAFLMPVIVDGGDRETLLLRSAIVGAIYLPLSLVLGSLWAERAFEPTWAWLRDERQPTPEERDIALREPLMCTKIAAFFWAIAAVIFGLLQIDHSVTLASVVCDSILLGGVTTCALNYLLNERALRPVVAIALSSGPPSRPVTPGVRARLMMAWALATGVPLIGIFAIASAGVFGADLGSFPGAALFLSVVGLGTGLLATLLVARSVADPVSNVGSALARVEEGDLEVTVPVDDGSEIGLLQSGFNRMASRLRDERRTREIFGRQVGEDVARAALNGEVELGGEVRDVAVLFVDLVGSTELATDHDPAGVVDVLNEFFGIVVETVEEQGGWVNKFEGDAALCVFGAPGDHDDPAGAALRSARTMSERLSTELPKLDAGIGVSAGRAVAGNVGTESRYEYTVIGDPVNEAARLCELAKRRPQRVLAAHAAVDRTNGSEAGRWLVGDDVMLRGRRSVTRVTAPA